MARSRRPSGVAVSGVSSRRLISSISRCAGSLSSTRGAATSAPGSPSIRPSRRRNRTNARTEASLRADDLRDRRVRYSSRGTTRIVADVAVLRPPLVAAPAVVDRRGCEELREVALVRADGVRRRVAVEPRGKSRKVFRWSRHQLAGWRRRPPSTVQRRPARARRAAVFRSSLFRGGERERLHDAEGDVARLVVAPPSRATRSRPARRWPSCAARPRGSPPSASAAALMPASSPDAADSTYPSTPEICPAKSRSSRARRLPRLAQHGRPVDVGVAVHHAEPHELGLLEPGDHAAARAPARPTSAASGSPTRLKWSPARLSWRSCTTAYGRRPVRGIGQADRLHRAEPQRVAPAVRHHLDGQAPLEERARCRSRARSPTRRGRSAS